MEPNENKKTNPIINGFRLQWTQPIMGWYQDTEEFKSLIEQVIKAIEQAEQEEEIIQHLEAIDSSVDGDIIPSALDMIMSAYHKHQKGE